MAGQADNSIVIDASIDAEGFKAGSKELLDAIKSLANEVRILGENLKSAFKGSDKGISGTDEKAQALEATISGLQEQVKSLQDTVSVLKEKLDAATSAPTEVDFDTDAAEAKISALENKIRELESTIASLQNGGGGTATQVADFGGTSQKTSGLQSQINALNNSVERLAPTFERAMDGSESAMASFRPKAESLNSDIERLEQQLQALGETQVPTQAYQDVSNEVQKLEENFNSLLAKQEKMQAMGVSTESNQWKSVQYDMEAVSNKYHELLSLKQQFENSGGAYVNGADTSQYAQMESSLSAATQQLQWMESELSYANNEWAQMTTLSGYVKSAIAGISMSVKSAFSGIGNAIMHPLQTADRLLGAMVQKAGRLVKALAGFAVNKLVSGLKSAASSMAKMVGHGRSMNSQFGGLISGAKKFALSLLGARGVYAILRKAVSAYMQENQELSARLSACWSGIGNVLGPIITRIVNLVATATAYLTKFLQLLGFMGKSTKKAISSAGGAAAKETDKLKRSMASFDELNILNNDKADNSSGGGGGDATAELPNVSLPDWAQLMVEQLKSGQWAEAAKTLTNQLNTMVSNVDWTEVGDKIGYYLNGALTFLATAITNFDWYGLGASLGELINRVIYGVDWGNFGIILGGRFIVLIEGLGGVFATIDWAALGKALADGFMGLWNAIDWKQAAKMVSDGVIGIINTLSSAINNMDWKKLGNDVAALVLGIDWGGVATALLDGLGAALGGLCDILAGFFEGIGLDAIAGLLKGLGNAMRGIGAWLKANIVDPIVNFVKNLFGIHSPSTVFAEIGGFLIEGLLDGISAAWSSITDFFTDALSDLKNLINDAWDGIKSAASSAWSSIGSAIGDAWDSAKSWTTSAVKDIKSKTSDTWKKIKSGASTAWSNVTSTVSDAWRNIKKWCSSSGSKVESSSSSVWSGIKSTIATQMQGAETIVSTAWGYIKNTVSNTGGLIKAAVSGDWGTVKDTISTQMNNTKTVVSTAWAVMKSMVASTSSSIKSTVSTAWNNIKSVSSSAWSAINATIRGKWDDISSTISSKISSVKSNVSSGFNNIKSDITSKMSSALSSVRGLNWYSVGSDICSGIGRGIDSGWSWLRNKVSSVANSLLRAAKSALGIHSPSRVFRDVVGLNIGYGIGEGIENSEGSVVRTVSGVADAIAKEFNSSTYSFGDINTDVDAGVARGLNSFSDTITDSFTNLIDHLQAIADRVTFTTPAILNRAVPYSAVASVERASKNRDTDSLAGFSSDVDERLADLGYQLKQILAVVKALNLSIDINTLADAITQQQRSKLRNFGGG